MGGEISSSKILIRKNVGVVHETGEFSTKSNQIGFSLFSWGGYYGDLWGGGGKCVGGFFLLFCHFLMDHFDHFGQNVSWFCIKMDC